MAGDLVGMILCAGLGTRLRPLSDVLPKPALPVGGLPLVRYALARLACAGVRRALVNVHHLPEAMEAAARLSAAALGVDLAISREPEIAGTGGALREARRHLEGARAILLLNGDVLFDVDLGAALAAHQRSGALATLILAPMPPGSSYAAVEADAGLAVRRIAGAGPGGEGLVPWHFTGAHVLSPEVVHLVPTEPFSCDVNRQVYPPLLDGRVRAAVDLGFWRELGTAAGYLSAHRDLLRGRVPLARFPGADPFAGLAPGARSGIWLGEGARVDPGATVEAPAAIGPRSRVGAGAAVGPDAWVGAGCEVGAGALVRGAVVWDGTRIAPGEEVLETVAAGEMRVAAR